MASSRETWNKETDKKKRMKENGQQRKEILLKQNQKIRWIFQKLNKFFFFLIRPFEQFFDVSLFEYKIEQDGSHQCYSF